ncbi:C-type lectin mannose-binding isoform-like [Puntigrus tetrazona]|uniref:C-type lectin mannose-binding isoform-like n=1 Tax=Puntigrus tetrazona TaxID=1606681 RepID=UPI001C8A51E3|nr:C-type lectin mannose-binding isoform-like [Puntigrus tetrazona]XP_043118017.1 C-type lectin mannose-binding isoform-like [Puntigrus tetrazona]
MMDFIFALLLALSSCVNSYMFYFNPDFLNWTEAQTYCRTYYTDLATTDDDVDYDDLLKTVPEGFTEGIWIGLYRTSGTAPWVWSDQSTSTFRIWGSGQPNNFGGNQFCVGTSLTGLWNDADCPTKYASVCYSEKKMDTVRLEVKSSQNMKDPAVITEVLLQIEKILKENGMAEDVKLSWKMQKDGNFFQNKTGSDIIQEPCHFKIV